MYVCVCVYIYIYINNPLSCKVRHNRAMITHSLTHTCMCVSIAYTPMNRNIETLWTASIRYIKDTSSGERTETRATANGNKITFVITIQSGDAGYIELVDFNTPENNSHTPKKKGIITGNII